MKASSKLILTAVLVFFIQSWSNAVLAKENEQDVRVQAENNKVRVWLLNKKGSSVILKIYDENNKVIKLVDLGNALTTGKILDFNDSERQKYRFVLLSDRNVVYNDFIQLGKW